MEEDKISITTKYKNERYIIKVNGITIGKYRYIYDVIFSRDKKSYGFIAQKDNGKQVAVINGKEGKEYKRIYHTIWFSPDGKNYGYRAQKENDKEIVVINGIESKEYIHAYYPIEFSKDSKNYGYVAQKEDGKDVVIINGIEKAEGERITNFCFNEDNKTYTFTVGKAL